MRRAGACALLVLAGTASAGDFTFNPYAASQYMYDSNVYRFSSQVAEVTGTLDTADRSRRQTAGVDAGYTWQQQKLLVMAEGRRIDFDEFTHLQHNEYALAASFNGAVLSNTKGVLEARDERRMASFEDRRTTRLIMEREQVGHGELTVAVTPEWRIVTGARGRNLRSPMPDAPALPQPPPGAPARLASPDFGLHEAAVNAGVQYGIENKEHPEDEAPLLLGVLLEYSTVNFSGVTPQPPPPPGVTRETFEGYSLLALDATAQYAINGLSSLDGKLGCALYHPSTTRAIATRPALTGDIGYIRRMSVITELHAHVFRHIVPYAATADATTDMGISAGAKWEPIRDLTLLGDYSYADSAFTGLSGVAPENAGRRDKVQNATVSIAYPQLRTFFFRVFGAYSDRRSSLAFDNFKDVSGGIELSFRWGGRKPAE